MRQVILGLHINRNTETNSYSEEANKDKLEKVAINLNKYHTLSAKQQKQGNNHNKYTFNSRTNRSLRENLKINGLDS